MTKPIDFVVLWVDGNDPDWQAERAKYVSSNESEYTNGHVRYRDWDIFKYWFRGVEKFTPWVNKIHLVTCGHFPDWLNKDHPKLNTVTHEQYMNLKYLPTFNSSSLELNIHRISNLSEQFVFFNDDMMVIDYMKESDFFVNDLPYDEGIFGHHVGYSYEDEFYHYLLNCTAIINEHFDFVEQLQLHRSKFFSNIYADQLINNEFYSRFRHFPGFYTVHLPQNFLKSTFEQVWNTVPDILDKVSSHRFRNVKDVTQYLMRYWQLMSGNFEPSYWRKKGWSFNLSSDINRVTEYIKKQERPMICVNDSSDVNDFEYIQKELVQAFQSILPEKSQFEK